MDTKENLLIETLRENLRLLNELSARYQIDTNKHSMDNDKITIASPLDVQILLQNEISQLCQEQLRLLLLNNKHQIIGERVMYIGNFRQAIVRTSEIVRPAIVENAPNILVVHNHPSGDPTPSSEDIQITDNLIKACQLLDIKLLDHIIIGNPNIISFKENDICSFN